MLVKIILISVSLLFLLYMVLPGPEKISDFSPLPNSLKSDEPGDTIQVPNITAYFSYSFRNDVVNFYKKDFFIKTWLPIPPFSLNHPPELAYNVIREQTYSTYLEELVFPLRDSLFISGFEPFYENGSPKFFGATDIVVNNIFYKSKTTLRFYHGPLWAKVMVWLGINISFIMLFKMGRKVLANG